MKRDHEPTESFRAREALRRSSAAQPHADRRTRRSRTRQDALRRSIKDSQG